MLKFIATALAVIFLFGCASTKTASYRYAQKMIGRGDLNFETLHVDEYVNAFPQGDLAKPGAGEDLAVQIDSFTDVLPKGQKKTLAQVALRTREANEKEKAKKFGFSLVLDISGSMETDGKFTDAIGATLAMVSELPEGTEFALTTFSDEATVVVPQTIIDKVSREEIKQAIKKIQAGGGTNIEAGLTLGYQTMAKFSKGLQSRLLLLTDGRSNVGVTDPKELAKKAGVQYLEGARISTLGLGHDVDEKLLRLIAENGRGAYYFAENGTALKSLFMKDVNSLMIPVAKSVSVQIHVQSARLVRVYGYDQSVADNTFTASLGELNSDDWRILIVELEGAGPNVTIEASVQFTSADGKGTASGSVSKTIATGSTNKPILNTVVARNATLFSNALALIEVSKLNKTKQYKAAEDLVDLQLANLEIIRAFDSTPELANEAESLTKIKYVLQEKQGEEPRAIASASAPPAPTQNDVRPLIKGALAIAEKVVPGPWSLMINLLGAILE